MFSKNLKDYQEKFDAVKKEFLSIKYVCSPQLEGYVLGIPGHILQKTKIKQGDIFTIEELRGFNYADIRTNYLEYFRNIPSVVLDTCSQVSPEEEDAL